MRKKIKVKQKLKKQLHKNFKEAIKNKYDYVHIITYRFNEIKRLEKYYS